MNNLKALAISVAGIMFLAGVVIGYAVAMLLPLAAIIAGVLL